jgi:hypothetical protein
MPNRGRRQGARTIQTRWMLAAVVVSVLSGCMVGPDYQRPALSGRALARAVLGWEFPLSALSIAERVPSPTITHVSSRPP